MTMTKPEATRPVVGSLIRVKELCTIYTGDSLAPWSQDGVVHVHKTIALSGQVCLVVAKCLVDSPVVYGRKMFYRLVHPSYTGWVKEDYLSVV